MIACRTLAYSLTALVLATAGCGDDEEVSTGLSAGPAGGMESSGTESGSSAGSSSDSNPTTGSSNSGSTTAEDTTSTSTSTTTTTTTDASTGDPSTTSTTTTTTTGNPGECGNGSIDANEQCDGQNLNGFTCESLGNAGGTLGCDPVTCTFDTSLCDGGGGTSG